MNKQEFHILVAGPNWVGDLIMATPMLRDLKRIYPQAKITLLVKKHLKNVIKGSPDVHEVLEWKVNFKHTLKLIKQLRKKKFSQGYLLTNSFSSAFFFFCLKIKKRIGYARDGRSFLINHKVYPEKSGSEFVPKPMVQSYLELVKSVGVSLENETEAVSLYYSKEELTQAEQVLQNLGVSFKKPFVLLNPGASFGSAKCWPPHYFAQLGDLLVKKLNCEVLILCGPDPSERNLAQKIQETMTETVISTHEQVINLSLLKPVVEKADLMVTNDSGPKHYAAAFKTPTITIYGSTHQIWSQYQQENSFSLQKEVPCGPCMKRVCPEVLQNRTHQCMELVTPEEVFEKATILLKDKATVQ